MGHIQFRRESLLYGAKQARGGGLVKEVLRFTRISLPFEIVARRTRLTATVVIPPEQAEAAPPPAKAL